MLSIIAIIGKHRELGKDNKLLWNIPHDLERFRRITKNHPVIMGRKTFESIGHPLAGRDNIVLSSEPTFFPEGVVVVRTLDEALERGNQSTGSEEIFIIGGGSVYAQAMNRADRLYLTVVDEAADADTFFPDYSRFDRVMSQESLSDNGYRFSYLVLERG